MYKTVLYNIKKMKKMWGGGRGRGNIWTQNTLYVFKKRIRKNNKKNKKMTEPGFEPTTSGLEIH